VGPSEAGVAVEVVEGVGVWVGVGDGVGVAVGVADGVGSSVGAGVESSVGVAVPPPPSALQPEKTTSRATRTVPICRFIRDVANGEIKTSRPGVSGAYFASTPVRFDVNV
jgi:hypothetical protein